MIFDTDIFIWAQRGNNTAARKIDSIDNRYLTDAEAKARLSKILRLAERERPQRIGVRKAFIVVSERTLRDQTSNCKPLDQWLVDKIPRGVALDFPDRREPGCEVSS